MSESLCEILDGEGGEVLAVGFDEESTRGLVDVLAESEDPPEVRLLAREDVLKWIREDFVLASKAAELIEVDTLEVRAASEYLESTLLVTTEAVVSLVKPGDEHTASLVTTDEEFVEAARERWSGLWDNGEGLDLRTPARSRVLESLADEFGSEVESDFRTVLDSPGSMRDEGDVDEVAAGLLVAAKHEQLLYDISKWGEDVGVASKATFSRTKTSLEEQGLIETEKVPIDVGRPRLRLVLGDERLREAEVEELASVVRGMLSAVPA
nr:DUF5821 family protein [Halococcus sediminicola]